MAQLFEGMELCLIWCDYKAENWGKYVGIIHKHFKVAVPGCFLVFSILPQWCDK